MATSLVNLLTKVLTTGNVSTTSAVKTVSANPFANPFVTQSTVSYAKNNPVKGGYFAGYYNNKPNIVGQRLFVEV